MAKIETVGFNPRNPDDKAKIINVSASVGANGVNNSEDVIVVQALLKYALGERREYWDAEFPEPSGAFIDSTARLIKKFQRHNNRAQNVRVAIDGRIDPVKGGAYAQGTKKHWTIYSLNVSALEIALLNGHNSAIEGICKRWSFIQGILSKNGVGSLGLELE